MPQDFYSGLSNDQVLKQIKEGKYTFSTIDKAIEAFGQTRQKSDLEKAVSEVKQFEEGLRGRGINPDSIAEFQNRKRQVFGLPNPTNAGEMVGGFNPAALKELESAPIFERYGYQRGAPAKIPGAYNPSQFSSFLGEATGTADYAAQREALNKEANEKYALAPEEGPGTARSSIEKLRSLIAGGTAGGATPAVPRNTLAEKQTELQTQYLDPLENDYNTAKADLRDIENQILTEQENIKGEAVSSRYIGRRLAKLTEDRAQGIRAAEARVRDAADRLDSKQKSIAAYMNILKSDYQDARDEYEFDVNKQIQLYGVLSGEANRQEDNARASLDAIFKQLEKTGTNPQGISEDTIRTMRDLGVKTGIGESALNDMIASLGNTNEERAFSQKNDDGTTTVFYQPKGGGKITGFQTYGTAGTGGGGNKLTLNEARTMGLPTSLVGKSEAEIGRDLAGDTPPLWFREISEQSARQSLATGTLGQLWNTFSAPYKRVLQTGKSSAGGSSSGEVSEDELNNLLNNF